MEDLLFKEVKIRAVDLPLKNPIVSHLGTFERWPYLCVDVITNQNVIGNSYIGPYLKEYLPAIASSIKVLCKSNEGKIIEPYTFYQNSMKSLSFFTTLKQ